MILQRIDRYQRTPTRRVRFADPDETAPNMRGLDPSARGSAPKPQTGGVELTEQGRRSLKQVSMSRWSSWVAVGGLALLTLASAAWSVSTSPKGTSTSTVMATSQASGSTLDTAPPGAHLTVSPKTVGPDQPFRLSGTDCPSGDQVLTGQSSPVTPESNGSWSVVVRGSLLLDTMSVGAECVQKDSRSEVFSYSPAHIRVTPLPRGARITVSPEVVIVGQSIRMSGNECFPSDYVIPDSTGTVSAAYGTYHVSIATPGSDGSWSAVVPVIDAAQVGDVSVSATCVTGIDREELFSYPAVHIEVNTYRHLHVTPSTTIRAGTTLTITSIGPCPSQSQAQVYLQSPDNLANGVPDGFGPDNPSGGEWSATLPIPPATAPGSYVLQATCLGDHTFLGYYSGLPITVTAG